eukprot:Skav211272  [mRNA]  locus=scaffold2429:31143:33260:+ [translate_table: standard]
MGLIILANLVLIIYEANEGAKCYPDYSKDIQRCPFRSESNLWLTIANVALLAIFSVECMLRAYVERGSYFWNKWNIIDLFTVVSGWLGLAANGLNVTLLRMFRLVRVLRALRVLISVPEFYLLITGLYSSIKAIIFGALMLVAVLIFWAVVSVEVLHPIASSLVWEDCHRCPDGFRGIFAAAVTLFQQIVAGDSWGQISIPLVEEAPWTAIILFFILITISLGMLNLILAVIVERASEARENDHEAKIKKKQQDRARSMEDLATICASMDENNNGMISFEELLNGYDEVNEFKKMMDMMDLKREDMATVFNVLDTGKTREIPYVEFCQHLGNFFRRDPVIMHSLVKYSVMEVRELLKRDILQELQQQSQMLELLLKSQGLTLPAEEDALQERSNPVAREDLFQAMTEGLENLSLSADLQRLDQELQALLAKVQNLAEGAEENKLERALKSSREETLDIDALEGTTLEERKELSVHERRFRDLWQRFQARIWDAQRLQERCSSLAHDGSHGSCAGLGLPLNLSTDDPKDGPDIKAA